MAMMAKNESNPRFIFILILILWGTVLGCNAIQPSRDIASLTPVPILTVSDAVVFLDEGENVRERMLNDPAIALAWEQRQEMFPVGGRWGTWINIFTLSNSEDSSEPTIYHLSSQQPAYGRLLVSNVFHTPHRLGLIFLLDYQPLQIQTDAGIQMAYYLPEMAVGEEQAVEFLFPPLPKGLHYLSVLLITDPESESTDPNYRWSQQQSFSEQRFDLWVDIEALPADAPTFANQEQAMAANFRLPFDIVKLDASHQLIETLEFEAGTENEVGLLFTAEEYFSNLPPYTGTLPVRIGVFWNDTLHTAFDYELDPKLKLSEPLLLPFPIEAPAEPGSYQLHVVAFATPWHPHFNADGEWIAFNHASFSRRIPVSVVEKR